LFHVKQDGKSLKNLLITGSFIACVPHYLTINATAYCLKVIFDKPSMYIRLYDPEKSYLPETKGNSPEQIEHTLSGH
jgi:hypothetical protein